MVSRRAFLKTGAYATAASTAFTALPRPLYAYLGNRPEPVPSIDDPRLKELTQRGIDAARSAGATYADVRLSHTRERVVLPSGVGDSESMTVSVRALVNGYWGFASGPVWSSEEMVRLAREASQIASTNALGKPRVVDLAPVPSVPSGHWATPVKIDPFEVYPMEICDFLQGLKGFAERQPYAVRGMTEIAAAFRVQNKAFAATTGTYCTQRLYRGNGKYRMGVYKQDKQEGGHPEVDLLTHAGLGWELFRDQPLREAMLQAIDEVWFDSALPLKSVDVGRYDIVLDAMSTSNLLGYTIGEATQVDRALGYEANAGGTSYLNEPLEMLGTFKVGAPELTVTANRSEAGGVATVKWDDEGVAPDEYAIVQGGILADYHTTREGAGWIKEYYAKRGGSFRSHGCAYAPSALEVPLAHTSNLVMQPGTQSLDFEGLVAGLKRGIAFKKAQFTMDFQHLNGLGTGNAFEIKDGKRIARMGLGNVGILFRTPELWKGIIGLGGASSARRYGWKSVKGEPPQSSYFSATAVPVAIKDATIIDVMRKA
jgi:TldD protein